MRNWEAPADRLKGISALLERLAKIAAAPPTEAPKPERVRAR